MQKKSKIVEKYIDNDEFIKENIFFIPKNKKNILKIKKTNKYEILTILNELNIMKKIINNKMIKFSENELKVNLIINSECKFVNKDYHILNVNITNKDIKIIKFIEKEYELPIDNINVIQPVVFYKIKLNDSIYNMKLFIKILEHYINRDEYKNLINNYHILYEVIFIKE